MATKAEQGNWFDGLIGDRQTNPIKKARIKVGLGHLHEHFIHGEEAGNYHSLTGQESRLFITAGRALIAGYEDIAERMIKEHEGSPAHTYYESKS